MPRDAWPQQGIYPTDGVQCGPYTANEWAGWMSTAQRAGGMVRTGAASPPGLPATPLTPNVGVYYHIPNRLAVTEAPANQINIDTGAWLCDGRFGFNDTAITGIVPAVGPRTDYVVVRQNYSGADFTTGPAGAALTVAANTCNVTIINSANFTQDQDRATYWDIPLASYDIDAGGVITNVTDLREWVDAETKRLIVPFIHGWDVTLGAPITEDANYVRGMPLIDANDGRLTAKFGVPNDFISGMTAMPILIEPGAGAGGNTRLDFGVFYATCNEAFNTHTNQSGFVLIATGIASLILCPATLTVTLANAATGDFMSAYLNRTGGHANDTAALTLYSYGVLVEYLGWGRK